MRREAEPLQLKVELMDDPCLWRWAICDATGSQIVADSWTREWTAFQSREEAYRAGCARLDTYEP